MRYESGRLIFSPTDLNRFFESPFTSWMARLQPSTFMTSAITRTSSPSFTTSGAKSAFTGSRTTRPPVAR
jgi:hypothetical protein